MDISEGDKKWKAAYEASGLDQKLAQQIRGAWDRTSITTAATYPGRLQSVGLKAHEISSLMPDHWKETYVEVFDAEVLARWRARYTNFGLTYSLGRAIGLSLSRVPTDVAVTYPACLRGIGLTVAEVNKILVNAGFDEYVLDDEQETSSAGDDEDEGYDGLEEIDDDVGGT